MLLCCKTSLNREAQGTPQCSHVIPPKENNNMIACLVLTCPPTDLLRCSEAFPSLAPALEKSEGLQLGSPSCQAMHYTQWTPNNCREFFPLSWFGTPRPPRPAPVDPRWRHSMALSGAWTRRQDWFSQRSSSMALRPCRAGRVLLVRVSGEAAGSVSSRGGDMQKSKSDVENGPLNDHFPSTNRWFSTSLLSRSAMCRPQFAEAQRP